MAAIVEVVRDTVVATDAGKILGHGKQTYQLRDYDFEVDVSRTKTPNPPDSTCRLTLDLGKQVGTIYILSQEAQTSIGIEQAVISTSIAGAHRDRTSCIIFGERDYQKGKPDPFEIFDSKGELYAVVTHVDRPLAT